MQFKVKTTNVRIARCPYCQHRLNAATHLHGASPRPGDLTLCINCAELLMFGAGLRVRKLTRVELAKAQSGPTWVAVEEHSRVVRAMIAARLRGEAPPKAGGAV